MGSHLGFYFDRMDAWFEEDQEVFVHPTDPMCASTSATASERCGLLSAR